MPSNPPSPPRQLAALSGTNSSAASLANLALNLTNSGHFKSSSANVNKLVLLNKPAAAMQDKNMPLGEMVKMGGMVEQQRSNSVCPI